MKREDFNSLKVFENMDGLIAIHLSNAGFNYVGIHLTSGAFNRLVGISNITAEEHNDVYIKTTWVDPDTMFEYYTLVER